MLKHYKIKNQRVCVPTKPSSYKCDDNQIKTSHALKIFLKIIHTRIYKLKELMGKCEALTFFLQHKCQKIYANLYAR